MKRVFLILICLISFIKVSALELDNYDFYITNDEYNIEIGHDDRTSYGITVDEKQLMINEKINFKLNNAETKEFVKIIPKSFYYSPFEEEKRIWTTQEGCKKCSNRRYNNFLRFCDPVKDGF